MKQISTLSALVFLLFLNSATGQVLNDYRSAQSGNWNVAGTWQIFDGTGWVAASVVPTTANKAHSVEIQSGHTVTQASGGLSVCRITADAGGTFVLTANTVIVDSTGTDLTINGSLQINTGGALSFSAASATAVVNGSATWNAGVLQSGTWTIASGATFTIATTTAKTINSANLTVANGGIINWNDGCTFSGSGGAITNNGIENVNGAFAGNVISQSNNRSILLQAAGDLPINFFTNGSGATVSGTGNFYALGGFTNFGILSPGFSPGILNLATSTYSGGVLNIEILDASGPGTGNDVLAVKGAANLTGVTLNVTELAAAPAGSYVILTTTGVVTGPFQTTNLPAGYSITYDANDVVLTKANLPLTWVSFSGQAKDNMIVLDWVTGIESNTDYFGIEQSADGNSFVEVGRQKAAGETSGNTRYSYTQVPDVKAPFYFYRLREVDLDGKESFSGVIKVNLPSYSGFAATINPNPVRDMLKITASGVSVNETLLLEIVSTSGTVICQKPFRATGSTTVKLLPRPAASSGIYFYRIIRKSNSQMVRGRIVFM